MRNSSTEEHRPLARSRFALLLVSVASSAVFVGCGKSGEPPPPHLEVMLRADWLGSAQIASDTNAATPLRILSLPESTALREQTLDKLSQAPWTLMRRPLDTNASAALRPLLDDLLSQEVRFEWAGATNQSGAFVLAVRLTAERAALWNAALKGVLQSLAASESSAMPDGRPGWMIQRESASQLIACTRSGDWTLIGVARDLAAFDLVAKRLAEPAVSPSVPTASNLWLTVTADLPRLARILALNTRFLAQLPELQMNVVGDGGRTRTEMQMTFAEPLDMDLPEWDIPTHLIDQPCSSLTICRGLPGMLFSLSEWEKLQVGPPPDQFFVWGFQGQFMQSYFLLDVPNAAESVQLASKTIYEAQTNWFGTNSWNYFVRSKKLDGLRWQGFPYMYPFLRTMETNGQSLVLGGAFVWQDVIEPLSSNFFDEAVSSGEVVYYDWERTDQRVPQWLYMSQFIRQACQKAQLPFESAALLWLKAIAPELEDTITRISVSDPRQLVLSRTSDLGLTSIELHFLADWLTSPTLPVGLHTFIAPPPPPEEF